MELDKLPDIIKVRQLARLLHIKESIVQKAIKEGDLRVHKICGDLKIEKESVIQWVNK